MSTNKTPSPETEAEHEENSDPVASYIKMARERHVAVSDNELEIDAEPVVSISDDGAWVAAWVWVRRPDSWNND
jgi:hypothetical protein